MLNKLKHLFSRKHRIVLIGDSHIRGYVNSLKPLLSSDYKLYCVVKPGSGTGELTASASEVIRSLSHDDFVVVCSGSNDYNLNGFSLTFRNIKHYMTHNRTNILLMKVPYRYDLPNVLSVNENICTE
jgi:diphthamide synthase subunit DPH2